VHARTAALHYRTELVGCQNSARHLTSGFRPWPRTRWSRRRGSADAGSWRGSARGQPRPGAADARSRQADRWLDVARRKAFVILDGTSLSIDRVGMASGYDRGFCW